MKKSVVIVAGGSGTRMNLTLPKQFVEIAGKPILVHTIEAFLNYEADIHIILVLPEAHYSTWRALQDEFLPNIDIQIADGGNSRFQSVKSGLSRVESGLVAIHDAVRPLISAQVIGESFQSAAEYGSGVVMVPLKDSIRKSSAEGTKSEDRKLFFTVQTPQTFKVDLLKKCFEIEEQSFFTDDASVFEYLGHRVFQVIGDYSNIKITTPEDLIVAEALMKATKKASDEAL